MTEHKDKVELAELFDSHEADKAVSPEVKQKVKEAFLALEQILKNSFPNNKRLQLVLGYLETAAMFALTFL